jgi:hypothetical protein
MAHPEIWRDTLWQRFAGRLDARDLAGDHHPACRRNMPAGHRSPSSNGSVLLHHDTTPITIAIAYLIKEHLLLPNNSMMCLSKNRLVKESFPRIYLINLIDDASRQNEVRENTRCQSNAGIFNTATYRLVVNISNEPVDFD